MEEEILDDFIENNDRSPFALASLISGALAGLGFVYLLVRSFSQDFRSSSGESFEDIVLMILIFACPIIGLILSGISKYRQEDNSIRRRSAFVVCLLFVVIVAGIVVYSI